MSLKKIVNDVVVAEVTGVVFAGIFYGLSKAFATLKLKMISKAKYYNPDGSPIWPPNRGFEGNPTTTILEPIFVDRYGYDGGTFVSPKGTPYTERALPTGTDMKPYTVFEGVKPVEVQVGKIAPWFGEKGGGIQYEFNQKISDLIEQEILRKVGN